MEEALRTGATAAGMWANGGRTRPMVGASCITQMEISTKASGKTIERVAKAFTHTTMEQDTCPAVVDSYRNKQRYNRMLELNQINIGAGGGRGDAS